MGDGYGETARCLPVCWTMSFGCHRQTRYRPRGRPEGERCGRIAGCETRPAAAGVMYFGQWQADRPTRCEAVLGSESFDAKFRDEGTHRLWLHGVREMVSVKFSTLFRSEMIRSGRRRFVDEVLVEKCTDRAHNHHTIHTQSPRNSQPTLILHSTNPRQTPLTKRGYQPLFYGVSFYSSGFIHDREQWEDQPTQSGWCDLVSKTH